MSNIAATINNNINLTTSSSTTQIKVCNAIKRRDNTQCDRIAQDNSDKCSMHNNHIKKNGINNTARSDLKYKHKIELEEFERVTNHLLYELSKNTKVNIHQKYIESDRITTQRFELRKKLIQQQNLEKISLKQKQDEEIAKTGIDPDEEQNKKREIVRLKAYRHRMEQIAQRIEWEESRRLLEERRRQQMLAENQQQAVIVQNIDELQQIVCDNQNVHRERIVNKVIETAKKLLEIEVPEEYKSNPNKTSQTLIEILANKHCKLTPELTLQLVARYCQPEDIYNLGPGIYGKVLDGLWQYIKTSEHNEELCKRLNEEIQDSIGMCAQGNLSRLCNVVMSYMDGVSQEETKSIAENLGEEIPKLMEIENLQERVTAAYDLFVKLNVPEEQWDTWLNPLIESEDDVEEFSFIKVPNNNRKPTGIQLKVRYTDKYYLNEKLREQMPKLMNIKDLQERVNAAYTKFIYLDVSREEWNTWLNPLIESEENVESFRFEVYSDTSNEVMGIDLKIVYKQ
jgi:hypothetical protein